MAGSGGPIQLDRRQGVVTLTLDRPPLNILDLETIRLLHRAVRQLADDSTVHLLVVRGAGERAFSAGVAVEDHVPEKVETMLQEFHGALTTLCELPAVTLAVVQGHCLGGGMELASACDLIVASEDSTFGQPEIKLGCYPPFAAALYPTLIGPQRTADLLLTGRTFDCAEAAAIGFVARRVPAEELTTAVEELVTTFRGLSRAALRLTKKAIRAGRRGRPLAALAECEKIYLEELTQTEDMNEGLGAFLEKRRPDWHHR